jgi:hypothetical protein
MDGLNSAYYAMEARLQSWADMASEEQLRNLVKLLIETNRVDENRTLARMVKVKTDA